MEIKKKYMKRKNNNILLFIYINLKNNNVWKNELPSYKLLIAGNILNFKALFFWEYSLVRNSITLAAMNGLFEYLETPKFQPPRVEADKPVFCPGSIVIPVELYIFSMDWIVLNQFLINNMLPFSHSCNDEGSS